ncbi:MAG: hypothetical protein EOO11_05645 [Chitinophagaceae bacterium]|nr:MAG: hypothetical protein EOO11_05645 [Chitinophagaceae bacterium]
MRYTKEKIERLFFTGGLSVLSGLAFMSIKVSGPSIHHTRDLCYVEGTFDGYSKEKVGRGTSLTFTVAEYPATFKIKADFFGILDDPRFDDLDIGHPVEVGIARRDSSSLGSPETLFIYSLKSGDSVVLDAQQAIAKHNSRLIWVASSVFILAGGACIFFALKGRRLLKAEAAA